MNNFKFKAWDTKEKRMISHEELIKRSGIMDYLDDYIDVFNEMIGNYSSNRIYLQYTGLKDKYTNEIYDGDLIDCGDRICIVRWNVPNATWDSVFVRYKEGELNSNGITCVEWKYRAIVIGNLYNNPELVLNYMC